MVKNTDLFFHQNSVMDFPVVLNKVQTYFSEHYKELMLAKTADNFEQLKSYIQKYLTDNRLGVDGMDQDQLVGRLLREMAEYSFLTPYLKFEIPNVEGIEIDSWECVWIKFAGGRIEQTNETFFSPKHARDVMIRLLNQSKISTDPSHPLARGHLGKNIRITVNCGGGTLDEDVGVAASIRFINPNHLTKEDLINNGR